MDQSLKLIAEGEHEAPAASGIVVAHARIVAVVPIEDVVHHDRSLPSFSPRRRIVRANVEERVGRKLVVFVGEVSREILRADERVSALDLQLSEYPEARLGADPVVRHVGDVAAVVRSAAEVTCTMP